jgi:superfamily II DNA or RNA helicase
MTVTLRPYQTELIDDVRNFSRRVKRVVAVMPTGAGKGTTTAAMVASAAAKGRRVLVLAHRSELIDQLSGSLSDWGIEHGIIRAGSPLTDDLVQVGSVQTVVRRLDRLPEPDLIIQDEAHHLIVGNVWGKIIDHWPNAFLIGKTATPLRLSGEGLGEGHGGFFQAMVLGPTAAWLTDNGFLARARVFAPANTFNRSSLHRQAGDFKMGEAAAALGKREIIGDVIEHFNQHVPAGGTAIAFCCSVAHAEEVAAAFTAAGINAASIDGKMTREQRRDLLQQLESRTLRVLTSCQLIGEGINIPNVDACVLLRPTMSVSLHLQMIGRALRPALGKLYAIVLDHVGNCLTHGLPTDHREWSLEGKPKRSSDAPSVRVCLQCYAANPSTATHCGECGHGFPVQTAAEIAQVAGELQELAPKGLRPGDTVQWRGKVWYIASHPRLDQVSLSDTKTAALALARGRGNHYDMRHVAPLRELIPTSHKPRRPSAGAQTYEDLVEIARARGYKPSWAKHIWAARQRR